MNSIHPKTIARSFGPTTVALVIVQLLMMVPLAHGQDQVRWRFRLDGPSLVRTVALGADGTLFTSDANRFNAISPNGRPLWTAEGAGGGRQISFGSDGTIYTGSDLVTALNPDGTLKWRFANPRPGLELAAGPNVGPDGNIYAAQDTDGDPNALGVFSLDPQGNLRWATRMEYPMIGLRGPSYSEIKFAADRMYVTVFRRLSRPPTLRVYDFEGDLMWYSADLALAVGGSPEIHPQTGHLILPWAQTGMQSLSPDGEVQWIREHPGSGSLLNGATISADGTIYVGDWSGIDWWAMDENGDTLWLGPPRNSMLQTFDITPDGTQIIAGGTETFGRPGWVRSFDTSTNGALRWSFELPTENGALHFAGGRMAMTPDSQTAYFTTYFNGGDSYGYVYSINLTDGCYADCDQSSGAGVLDLFDFLCFQDGFVNGEPYACDCDTTTGPGVCDVFDFLCFQNAFVAGCP